MIGGTHFLNFTVQILHLFKFYQFGVTNKFLEEIPRVKAWLFTPALYTHAWMCPSTRNCTFGREKSWQSFCTGSDYEEYEINGVLEPVHGFKNASGIVPEGVFQRDPSDCRQFYQQVDFLYPLLFLAKRVGSDERPDLLVQNPRLFTQIHPKKFNPCLYCQKNNETFKLWYINNANKDYHLSATEHLNPIDQVVSNP